MDFLNRNGQATQPSRPAVPGVVPQQQGGNHDSGHNVGGIFNNGHRPSRWSNITSWLRWANVIMLFSFTILAVAIALLLNASNPRENQYVADDKYQAVFLENGQVYFGKIGSLTSKYVDLQNVFYLNSTSANTSTDQKSTDTSKNNQYTLVKLGCELHGPYDQMIINRDQVTFWENLKDDGQVVKTIKEWIKQNPSGQKCSETTNSTAQSQSTGSSAQSAGTGTQNASNTTNSSNGTSTEKKQ